MRIAVVAFPSFSNFTDFDALRTEPSVSLRFCRDPAQLEQADIVILPGSKQTVDDLSWLRTEGLDLALTGYARRGLIVGICGGMQMLGKSISDPHGIETAGAIAALGLLPIHTTMQAQKVTSIATGRLTAETLFDQPIGTIRLTGYEIHVGETSYCKGARPFAQLSRQADGEQIYHIDGCTAAGGRVVGTYLHGLFDDDEFRHVFITAARAFYLLAPPTMMERWKQKREASLDRLADAVRQSVDMAEIFSWVGLPYLYSAPQQAQDGSKERDH